MSINNKNLVIIDKNKDVIVSHVAAMMHANFTATDLRILYHIIDVAQAYIDRDRIDAHDKSYLKEVFDTPTGIRFSMPVSELLGDKSCNYEAARTALRALAKKGFEYNGPEGWKYTAVLTSVSLNRKKGIATLEVHNDVWKSLLYLKKGFKKIELLTVVNFKCEYAMRWYTMLSGEKLPQRTWSVEDIQQYFGLGRGYSKPFDIERRCIIPAKEELDEKSPWTFEYNANFVPSRGKLGKKIVSWTFYPKYQADKRDESIEIANYEERLMDENRKNFVQEEIVKLLTEWMFFSIEGVGANRTLFADCQRELPDLYQSIKDLNISAKKAGKDTPENLPGYIINGLRNMLNEVRRKRDEQSRLLHERVQTKFLTGFSTDAEAFTNTRQEETLTGTQIRMMMMREGASGAPRDFAASLGYFLDTARGIYVKVVDPK